MIGPSHRRINGELDVTVLVIDLGYIRVVRGVGSPEIIGITDGNIRILGAVGWNLTTRRASREIRFRWGSRAASFSGVMLNKFLPNVLAEPDLF
jgi:hypothetical protein